MKTVQHGLGHADAALTLNVYGHTIPANNRSTADLMGTLVSQDERKANVVKLDSRSA